MDKPSVDPVPAVLIVTRHEKFAAAAARQLAARRWAVEVAPPDEVRRFLESKQPSPGAVFVDWDAKGENGVPVYQVVRDSLPECRIVLIAAPEQASAAADLALSAGVYDYVLTGGAEDPKRILFLAERARASVPKAQDDTDLQSREVLKTLAELRDLLRGDSDNPIVRLLDKYKVDAGSSPLTQELLQEVAEDYAHCLVGLICGRLRRLENQILLSGRGQARAPAGSQTGPILVVEDDDICGELAKNILEKNGFEVMLANSVPAARDALARQHPALVLMDVHLRDGNGIQLVESLRAGSTCPHVPVIVVTSDRMKSTLVDAVGANVQGYLLKPYEPKLLVAKVKAVLEKPQAGNRDLALRDAALGG